MRNKTNVREIYEGRMKVACEDSAKISSLIRYLAITGCALVWLLLQQEGGFKGLKTNCCLKTAVFLFCMTIIIELLHLGISVTINLYYATFKLIRNVSLKGQKTRRIPTKFPKRFLCVQWILWYLKFITLFVGYILICYSIFN